MPDASPATILGKLDGLRSELVELAFTLETRGRIDAADVAITTSARIGELCEEILAAGPSGRPAERRTPRRDRASSPG